MELRMDADLQSVAEFMQSNLPAAKLLHVAKSLAEVAPLLWGDYAAEPVSALTLRRSPIEACDPRTQSCASE